jgi:formiminoglutamase
VNLDAHADLRADVGRHSGNPFSQALDAGHLSRYAAIGLHEPYLNEHMWQRLHGDPRLLAITLESILRGEGTLEGACDRAIMHAGSGPASLEVDLDAVAGMPASASSPTGFQPEALRQALHHLASRLDARAMHVCEGIPGDGDPHGVGKFAAMLVCDFIRARRGPGA